MSSRVAGRAEDGGIRQPQARVIAVRVVLRDQSAVYAASVQPERRSSDAMIAWRRNALHALLNVSATLAATFECGTSDKVNA